MPASKDPYQPSEKWLKHKERLKDKQERQNKEPASQVSGTFKIVGLLFCLSSALFVFPYLFPKTKTPPEVVAIKPAVPNGWYSTGLDGIYINFCVVDDPDPACAEAEQNNDSAFIYRVWCRDRPCGDIYVRVNLVTDAGAVIDWTNATGQGQLGDVVYLGIRVRGSDGTYRRHNMTELRIGGEVATPI